MSSIFCPYNYSIYNFTYFLILIFRKCIKSLFYLEVEPRGKKNVDGEEKVTRAGSDVGADTMTAREHPDAAHKNYLEKVKLNDTLYDLNVVCDEGDVSNKNSNAVEGKRASGESPSTSSKLQQPDCLKISCKQKREKHIPGNFKLLLIHIYVIITTDIKIMFVLN